MSRLVLAVLLCAAVLVTSGPTNVACAGDSSEWWMIYPVNDESSVEKLIFRYMKKVDGVEAELRFVGDSEDDLALVYELEPKAAPTIKCWVDTEVSGRDESKVRERVVKVTCFYVLPDQLKTDNGRAKLLEAINRYHQKYWMPHRFYLDKEGDIVVDNAINIPGKSYPVHAEMVRDVLLRTISGWDRFYEFLVNDLGLPKVSGGD